MTRPLRSFPAPVTSEDVQEAKRYCAEHHGTKMKLDGNPYNFMKDIVRGKSASRIWPQRLKDLGIEVSKGQEMVPFLNSFMA